MGPLDRRRDAGTSRGRPLRTVAGSWVPRIFGYSARFSVPICYCCAYPQRDANGRTAYGRMGRPDRAVRGRSRKLP